MTDQYLVIPVEGVVLDPRPAAEQRARYLARSQGAQLICRVVAQIGDHNTELHPDPDRTPYDSEQLALNRIRTWYGALPEMATVLRMAENWQQTCANLRAIGWQRFSPASIAANAPCVFPSCRSGDGLHG